MTDTNCFVKSDLYPQPDGTVRWTAIAICGADVALLYGVAMSVDDASQQIVDAIQRWTEADEVKETRVQRIVNRVTGHRDNLN